MSDTLDDADFPESARGYTLPKTGDVIDGKYRVGQPIGEGGMGLVLAGEHALLKQPIAIKVLAPKYAADKTFRARFLREARTAASLTSEHAVRIIDVGTTAEHLPFMVMELLVGESLEERVERGPIAIASAVDFVLQALVAVGEAHGRGLVHRDLKPGNLFLVPRDDGTTKVKVLDFGISKVLGEVDPSTSDASLTAPRTLLGSPLYMSPEQLRDSSAVDARADIWAMGVVLFELVTGRAPFESDSVPELYAKILNEEAPSLRKFVPSATAQLDAVVRKCLAKDRENRFADAAELTKELTRAAALHVVGTADTVDGAGVGVSRKPRRRLAAGLATMVLLPIFAVAAHRLRANDLPTSTIPTVIASETDSGTERLPSVLPSLVVLPPSSPFPSSFGPDAGPSKPAETASGPKPSGIPRVKDLKQIKLIE